MFKQTLRAAAAALGYEVRRRQLPAPGSDWVADLKRLLPADHSPVLFDVGANVGQTSLALAAAFAPPATIYAFEPAQVTFTTLTNALAPLPHTSAHQLALGDHCGRIRLHHGHNSQLHRIESVAALATGTSEEIEITTLDEFTRTHDIARLALLKTDTEGHDATVLRGAHRLLDRGAIQAVLAEVTFEIGNKLHTPFDEIRALLEPRNFRLHNIYDCEHWGLELKYCNALFLHLPDFALPGLPDSAHARPLAEPAP